MNVNINNGVQLYNSCIIS